MNTFLKFFFFSLFTALVFGCGGKHSGGEPVVTNEPVSTGIGTDYEDFGRAIWQKPDFVIGQFGSLSGKTIADIGAGTGFFSRRMISKAEKVIAIDIDERFIHFLDSIRIRELTPESRNRLEPRLSKTDDPLLNANEIDGALIVNTFMYMENRVNYLSKVKDGLKPEGKLVIVDFKKRWTPIGPPRNIRLSSKAVEGFMKEAGFKVLNVDQKTLEFQYVIVAERV